MFKDYSHNTPTEETDGDHHEPAGDDVEPVYDVADRNVQSILSKPAIERMKGALIRSFLCVGLLGMNLVDSFRGDSGVVKVDNVQRHSWTRLTRLSLGELEVPYARRRGSPDRTKNGFLLTVQVAKFGRSWIRGK
jgi:hypothetical protein